MARIETVKQKQQRLFSEWVLIHLDRAGMSQLDLARELGVCQQSISKKLKGIIRWNLGDIAEITAVFHEDYLIAVH